MRTIEHPVALEIPRIKGSRFIGYLFPAGDVQAAMEAITSVRGEHPRATHWVFAWRIDEGETRSTDDGEPAGTAGRPLLDRLIGHDLEQVVVVVVRYYGGTKLGTGGLVRAYGAAASAAIEAATIVESTRQATVIVEVGPKSEGPVRGVARAHGATLVDTTWGAVVRMTFAIDLGNEAAFEAAVSERTAGRAVISVTSG